MFSFLRITQENPKQKRVFFTVVFSDLLNSFVRTFLNYSDLKDIDDDFNTQTDNFMKILGKRRINMIMLRSLAFRGVPNEV